MHHLVELGVVVGDQRLPVRDRGVPIVALWRVWPALEVVEGRRIGRDHAGPRAGLDRHVADRHPAFHRQTANRLAAILDDVALAATGADLSDDAEDEILRGHSGGQGAGNLDRHRLGALQRQRLSREHVLDLARPDPERQRAERAVRARVAVAAHDRHAGLRQAELRADHVNDALAVVAHREQPDAELLAVRRSVRPGSG